MNRDERDAFVRLLAAVGAGAVVMYLLYCWLGLRFVLGLTVGAFGDTLDYGLVLLRQRFWPPKKR